MAVYGNDQFKLQQLLLSKIRLGTEEKQKIP